MKGEEQKTGGVVYAGVSSRVDVEYCIHWSRLGLQVQEITQCNLKQKQGVS